VGLLSFLRSLVLRIHNHKFQAHFATPSDQ
jgi:hypothetical protein